MSNTVKALQIKLPDELYYELKIAAADSAELDEVESISPEDVAKELIESELASRRLERITAIA